MKPVFEDAHIAIREFMFEEIIFPDDLNAYKIVLASTSIERAIEAMDHVQGERPQWGATNQVSFDPSKERRRILSRADPFGIDFKLLGITFDGKLEMESAVRSLTSKVQWQLQMLLRSRRSLSTEAVVVQYQQ